MLRAILPLIAGMLVAPFLLAVLRHPAIEAMSIEERQQELFDEQQEQRYTIDRTVERIIAAADEAIDEAPPNEDATRGEFEPNDGDGKAGGE